MSKLMTTGKIADEYIAMRADHDVEEAASQTVSKHSITLQNLVEALGAEILNNNRPNNAAMQSHRNEVLSYFTDLKNKSESD